MMTMVAAILLFSLLRFPCASAAAAPNYVVSTVSGVGVQIETVTVDPNTQRVYMAGENMYAIKVMNKNGAISTIAGNGENGYADGLGLAARFGYHV